MNQRQPRKRDSCIPEIHAIFKGEIVSIKDYGAFVKIPGCYKNGLIHISQISQSKVDRVEDVVAVKDNVWCKVISLGEDGDKISLSMKVVNQGSGKDLDPNGVQIGLEEKRRKSFTQFSQPKIVLDAVFNTVCKKCGTKGHLAQDCFQVPGGKTYELVKDDKEESSKTRTATDEQKTETKDHKKKSKKRKHEECQSSSSSPSSDNSSNKDDLNKSKHQRHRDKKKAMKSKRKKKAHSRSNKSAHKTKH